MERAGELGHQASGFERWRPRAALAAVVALCVVVTGIAVAGAGNASPGLRFTAPGRWIYNSTLGTIFHVNGSAKNVDGQVPLPGAGPDTQVIETDRSGYALADGRIYEFGKSDLRVLDPVPVPVTERPVGLEAPGAAFAVYRKAGRVIRLGDRPVVDSPGVPLGEPVVTSAATLWIHRPDTGQLCQLPADAERFSCPAKVPLGHTGSLTLVGPDQVVFVDLTARRLAAVDADGLGRQARLPVGEVPGSAVVAGNDLAGRIPIVDPDRNVLHLVDPAEVTSGRPGAAPVTKPLPRGGRYERVASSGTSLALIDDRTDTLVTVDRDGDAKAVRRIPPPSKPVRSTERSGLYRDGDARLYVAGRAGEQVLVVDETGDVTPVDTTGTGERPAPKPTTTPSSKPSTAPTTGRPTTRQPTEPANQPTQQPTRRPTQPGTERTQPPPEPPRTRRPSAEKPSTPPTEPNRRTTPPETKPETRPTVRAGRPSAPRGVSGKIGNGSVALSWQAAAANGATISQYQVSWSGGTRTLAGSARSVTISGLTNGTGYVFTVRAVNQVGAGPGSSTARLTPVGGAADAPPNFRVVAGNGQVTLSWSRPNLHGNTFRGYQYAAQPVSSSSTTATRATITGLTNGTRYRITVQAITADAQGNLITGKVASRTVTVGSGGSGDRPTLVASKGAATTYEGDRPCEPPGCHFIRIVGTNLEPNTRYVFQPFTTEWQPSNPGATLTTDANGSITIDDRFPTDAAGQQVWVEATAEDGGETIRSNRFNWGSS